MTDSGVLNNPIYEGNKNDTATNVPSKKNFSSSIALGVKWIAHILLIPFVAVLKGLATIFTHLHDELAKF